MDEIWQSYILAFLISLKIISLNMITILMVSAKMATTAFLKVKIFWKTGYHVITSVLHVNSKVYIMTHIISLL